MTRQEKISELERDLVSIVKKGQVDSFCKGAFILLAENTEKEIDKLKNTTDAEYDKGYI